MLNRKINNKKGGYNIAKCNEGDINLGVIYNFVDHFWNEDPTINFYIGDADVMKLKDGILEYLGSKTIHRNNMLITNGSGAGLKLILNTYNNKNNTMNIALPNYPGFLHDIECYWVGNKYYTNSNIFLRSYKQGDIVYISNPNMPMGYSYNREELCNCIGSSDLGSIFIIDEAYIEYSGESMVDLCCEYKNVIITRTFSKAFGIASARVGYIIANADIINNLSVMYDIKDLNKHGVNLAIKALGCSSYYLEQVVKDKIMLNQMKQDLKNIVKETSMIYSINIGECPWILLYTKDSKLVCDEFAKRRMIVRDKSEEIKDCVRVGYSSKHHTDIINAIVYINESINLVYNNKYKTILFDIDGTLRADYNSPINKFVARNWGKLKDRYNIKIITNNTSPRSVIDRWLVGSGLSGYELYCPLDYYVPGEGWVLIEDILYITKFPDISHKLILSIVKSREIHIIENGMSTPSGEMGMYPDVPLPHIGLFMVYLSREFPEKEVKMIGKETLYINIEGPGLMIGDTDIDARFASNNKIDFVNVKDIPIETVLKSLINEFAN
jgi:histidinol-phosphate aminotransferase